MRFENVLAISRCPLKRCLRGLFNLQLATVQPNVIKAGTCPHGLPLGACPICNGMSGGGGAKKADFSAKPGEMSWNECAAIGAFLKAQQNARLARQQDAQQFAQQAVAFQNALMNASQRIATLTGVISNSAPAIIAKPVNFVLNNIIGGTINLIKNLPTTIQNITQFIGQKIADISDKLAAVYGEIKTAIAKKITEPLNEFKKKLKSLFGIFNPENTANDDKQIDETKKAFKLKTFIHDLYRKIKGEDEEETEKELHK